LTDEERPGTASGRTCCSMWDPASRNCRRTRDRVRSVFGLAPTNWAPPVCRARPPARLSRCCAALPFTSELRKAGVKGVSSSPAGARTPLLTLTDCEFRQRPGCSGRPPPCWAKLVLAGWPHLSEVPRGGRQLNHPALHARRGRRHPVRAALRQGRSTHEEPVGSWCGRSLGTGTASPLAWSQGALPFVLQRCLPEAVPESGPALRMEDVLPVGELAFVAKGNWYGMSGPRAGLQADQGAPAAQGEAAADLSVVDSEDCFLLLRPPGVPHHGTVLVTLPQQPKKPLSPSDLDANVSSSATDTRSRRLNIGLELKFNRAEQEVAGWTRKDASMGWQYSPSLAQVLCDYAAEFPELFRCLAGKHGSDTGDLLPCYGAERVPVGSSILSGRSVSLIRQALDSQLPKLPKSDVSATEIPAGTCTAASRHQALPARPGRCPPPQGPRGPLPAGGRARRLTVWEPSSASGPAVRESDPELELLLDEPFEGGIKIRGVDGCCLVSGTAILNLSHGERTNPNIRLTVACKDRPDQHVQLWADLQQHKQQQGRANQQPRQQQQQQQQQQQGSFNFSALVSALQQQQPVQQAASPARNQPTAEHESQRLLNSLLAEWDWPVPAIDFQ
uniref:SH3_12 domain-containing protein n=1 Tax=Macrostomum lignano TaxID=282301 RepID=A0A1I8FEW1_9PLAT